MVEVRYCDACPNDAPKPPLGITTIKKFYNLPDYEHFIKLSSTQIDLRGFSRCRRWDKTIHTLFYDDSCDSHPDRCGECVDNVFRRQIFSIDKPTEYTLDENPSDGESGALWFNEEDIYVGEFVHLTDRFAQGIRDSRGNLMCELVEGSRQRPIETYLKGVKVEGKELIVRNGKQTEIDVNRIDAILWNFKYAEI